MKEKQSCIINYKIWFSLEMHLTAENLPVLVNTYYMPSIYYNFKITGQMFKFVYTRKI